MTTDEVNEDEVFTALVKHRLSGIDPKYVPDGAVANIADAYTEWRSRVERAAAEKAWDRCVGEMPIDPDWKNFYGDNNPYRAAALAEAEARKDIDRVDMALYEGENTDTSRLGYFTRGFIAGRTSVTREQIAEAIEYAADWEHGFRDPEKVIAHIAETIRALFGEVAGGE